MRPESRPESTVESAAPKSSIKGVFIAFLYGACSLSMALMNKAVLNTYSFNYPMILVLCQMIFTVTLLEFLRLTNQITLPKFTLARGRSFLVPSIFYGIHSVLSLTALSGMNIPMYGVIKRCSPVIILLLGTIVLRKGLASVQTCVSVCLITFGCLLAGYGDLSFHLKAYLYGGASVFSQAIYLILIQKHGQNEEKLSAIETLHLNSCNILIALIIATVAIGNHQQTLAIFIHHGLLFKCIFLLVVMMGCLLNYLIFLCTTYNSALTTSITGTVKSILQTAIGIFTFGGMTINVYTVVGVTINLCGGLLYTHAKYKDRKVQVAARRRLGSKFDKHSGYDSEQNGIKKWLSPPGEEMLCQPHTVFRIV